MFANKLKGRRKSLWVCVHTHVARKTYFHPKTSNYGAGMCIVKWKKEGTWKFVIPDPWWESVYKNTLNFNNKFTNLRNDPES